MHKRPTSLCPPQRGALGACILAEARQVGQLVSYHRDQVALGAYTQTTLVSGA